MTAADQKLNTSALKKFAQSARRQLLQQVAGKLDRVLATGSLARRESADAVAELESQIAGSSREEVIERVAYTWFNRFCALRFMDVNRYTRIGVVSPVEGHTQPEILADAKQGVIDDQTKVDQQRVSGLLDGSLPSNDAQQEAYQLLLVAVCNSYHRLMPFMFERIADYTELLIPDDLLSESSLLAQMREALTPAACESVETIGWLYQFYISEKKDDVFAALKKGKKITPANIPAATQLFTPHWIVRYLVENSLGRLWMLNHPDSRLIDQMDYYIKPEEPETDFLQISSPEEIKICDPACGSGHMLTYAFDLLYAIYEEQGYQATDIPRLILTHNLYGIEIDQRAGALAAFALTMKAREKYRRFLTGGKVVQPNICVLENVKIDPEDLSAYMDKVGRDLFSGGLQGVVNQWEEADNFGSLIRPLVTDVSEVLELLRERQMGEDLFLAGVHQKVLKALRQADYLSPKYHVVVANPPYMSSKGMSPRLKTYVGNHYPKGRPDTFSAFMIHCLELASSHCAMVTPYVWMFLSSYEGLRDHLLDISTISSLIQLEYNAFEPACVPVCTFVLDKKRSENRYGDFIRLSEFKGHENQAPRTLEAIANRSCGWRFQSSGTDFRTIPSCPIAYWATKAQRAAFKSGRLLGELASPKQGIATADNDRFLRRWHEVDFEHIHVGLRGIEEANQQNAKWLPYNKGGAFRKWYGNNEFVINWENDGAEIRGFCDDNGKQRSAIRNPDFFFRPSATWTDISSSSFGVRRSDRGFLFDGSSHSAFPPESELDFITGLLCARTSFEFLKIINPTMHFQVGNVASIPVVEDRLNSQKSVVSYIAQRQIAAVKDDWDSFEVSWNFQISPIIADQSTNSLASAFHQVRKHWIGVTHKVHELDEENNRLFITAYGMSDELSTDVPLEQVTINWNPAYRYGSDKSDSELEALLLADTMREFISYSVGCMLGRYSLDKPGLILANQGETVDDYFRKVSLKTEPIDLERAIAEPASVTLVSGATPACFACGVESAASETRFVIAGEQTEKHGLRGRPLIYCGDCADEKQASYVTWQQPLEKFTVEQALDRQWCELDTLKAFLELANCFGHIIPTTADKVTFAPDEDNVIPLLDGEWFSDDIVERFKEFLKVTFGKEHYEENLEFLENGLYPDNLTGKKRKTIRDYFLKEFYNHHVKLYKKRPIYWLFSSPKGTFNALIYMHRYRPDTVSVVLNGYLREFITKLAAKTEHLQSVADSGTSSQADKTKALKEIAKLRKALKELEDYERDILFPLAQQQIEIDLDDGVKVNYNKFGKALKKVTGLTGK